MAERKLNFNAPLLSTRRMHKTAVSVRRNKTKKFTTDDSSSSSVQVLVSEIGLDQVTETASVPFTWEQAPGRLKENDLRPHEVCESKQQLFTPCLPPGKVTRFQSNDKQQVEEEESEDVFSDAHDTLSPKDSFSCNQSISGVSEYGGVVETKKKKKPLNLSEDSRDFMLNRFLPAAKAMTVEQPHYASNRKPSSFMSEPTIQEKRPTPTRCDESALVPYSHYHHQDIDDDEESEEEDGEDDQVSEYAYLSKRGCGMLPQLCFKDSLGMLNTVLGFKAKQKSPATSPSHDQVKSSKASQLKSKFQSAKKLALYSVSKQKLGGKVQSPVHESVGKKSNSESNLSVACRSSSPYRHSRCNGNSFAETRKETENLRANRLNKHIRNISTSLLENVPMTNDEHSSNVMISPEEAVKKPDANLELVAFEKISIVDGDDELGKISNGPDRSLLAPPSPKKPSDSWLLHNLPSVTPHIPSRRYHPFHHQKQDPKENSREVVTKWETIVKTSYMHRDHFRYSEEMVAHTSHQ
ncbi:unnamed protein product [Microthlaspi erraticum]|uniref:Uncharacterized protein n=1 Tax=Microthlaspi erraticum TaxID=1685480 RepID=A0A6D2IV24_9BRAS|nr:unnamed protein product [Microthlaspi erraticum]